MAKNERQDFTKKDMIFSTFLLICVYVI